MFAPLVTFSSLHVEYERILFSGQQAFLISDLWPSFIRPLRGPGPFSTFRWTDNPSPTSHHQWGTLWWRVVSRCPCSLAGPVCFSRVRQRHSHEPRGAAQGGRKLAPDASEHLKFSVFWLDFFRLDRKTCTATGRPLRSWREAPSVLHPQLVVRRFPKPPPSPSHRKPLTSTCVSAPSGWQMALWSCDLDTHVIHTIDHF